MNPKILIKLVMMLPVLAVVFQCKASMESGTQTCKASKLQDLSMQHLSIWQEENEKKGSRYEQMAAIDSQRYDLCKHNQHMAAIEEEKLQLMRKKVDILQTKSASSGLVCTSVLCASASTL
jgi:hypothetical protein